MSDFKLEFNTKNETWFVQKVKDELTKNHKEAECIVSGLMPENRDDRLCPVASFRKYLEHLEPKNPYLWQTPLKSGHKKGEPNIWYGMQHMGKNTLSGFMKKVSEKCKLSMDYTNHSIRVTGITVLTQQNFTNSEIMSVSGHKLVQSLTNYQKTRDLQKLEMGDVLFQSMTKQEENIKRKNVIELPSPQQNFALPAPSPATSPSNVFPNILALPPVPYQNSPVPANANPKILQPQQEDKVHDAVVPYFPNFEEDTVSDVDLISALCDVETEQVHVPTTSTAISNRVMNNLPKAMFATCHTCVYWHNKFQH